MGRAEGKGQRGRANDDFKFQNHKNQIKCKLI